MTPVSKSAHSNRRGAVLIVSMVFVLIFSALAVSMATLSGTSMQLASNHHKVNSALFAAESGMECGRYIIANTPLPSTAINVVTTAQADAVWSTLCSQVQAQPWVAGQATQTQNQIITPAASFGAANTSFQIKFSRTGTHTIKLEGIGANGQVTRHVSVDTTITKGNEVMNYAVASRGRMWLTGNSTIHGDVFSSWNRPEISPYNMTSDSAVLGTINTVLSHEQIEAQSYQLETLDANGNPIDANGAPLGSNYHQRYYGPDDEIQAYHEGINYERLCQDMPGMDIADYNTDPYNSGLTNIPSCPVELREVEYFPHASSDKGGYSMPRDGTPGATTNRKLTRFENCTFNGVIVSDVPQIFKWMHNALYFTGTATFENTSSVQEATILAPHFNVNLGNTNPQPSENNVLTARS